MGFAKKNGYRSFEGNLMIFQKDQPEKFEYLYWQKKGKAGNYIGKLFGCTIVCIAELAVAP